MKKILFLLVVLIVSLLFIQCSITRSRDPYSPWGGLKMIRGIELHITDAETNEPLSGICVRYQLSKLSPQNFVDSATKIIVSKKTVTNEEGIAVIKPSLIFLGLLQNISTESIDINIDVDKEKKPEKIDFYLRFYYLSSFDKRYRNEKIIIPNNNYYPARIVNFYGRVGYMLQQVSDSTSDIHYADIWDTNDISVSGWEGERFVKTPAPSDMQEKHRAVIMVGLKRSTEWED